jgi:hypothetical protein
MIQVVNSWDTNEILIVNKGNEYVLYKDPVNKGRWAHGTSKNGSIAISLKEALQLLYDLEKAIETYENLDEELEEINRNDTI